MKEIKKNEEILKAKARALSVRGGCMASISDGFGIRNITPYALVLGANNNIIGFLSSVPSLCGNFLQLLTFKFMEKHPRKRIVVTAIFLQAFMWLAILIPGILFFKFNISHNANLILLIIIYTFLISIGTISAPAWSSWMKDITDEKNGYYFGLRSKKCGIVALISMLIAGFILDYFKQTKIFIAFIILFGFSFLSRFISGYITNKKYEPSFKVEDGSYFSFIQFIKKMRYNNFGRFVILVSSISFATAIASPFFAVYILKELNFSYFVYILIIVMPSLTTLLSTPFWGRFADNYGNIKVIKMLGFFIPFVPIFWIFSIFFTNQFLLIGYLLIIEAFSGFIWGGFNLSASNFIYNAVTRQRMAICFSYFNILNGIGIFIGATLGGFLSSRSYSLFSLSPLLITFLVSGVIRLIVHLSLYSRINEVLEVKELDIKEMGHNFFHHLNLKGI